LRRKSDVLSVAVSGCTKTGFGTLLLEKCSDTCAGTVAIDFHAENNIPRKFLFFSLAHYAILVPEGIA
jgi:hypothetical protein